MRSQEDCYDVLIGPFLPFPLVDVMFAHLRTPTLTRRKRASTHVIVNLDMAHSAMSVTSARPRLVEHFLVVFIRIFSTQYVVLCSFYLFQS